MRKLYSVVVIRPRYGPSGEPTQLKSVAAHGLGRREARRLARQIEYKYERTAATYVRERDE